MAGKLDERNEGRAPVGPAAYTEEYFRSAVEGHREFAESRGRAPSARLLRALDLAGLRPGQRVLDVACGRGEVVVQGALRGCRALGVDYARAALRVAAPSLDGADELGKRAAIACMDATRLALRPQTFDVAFMLDFVEHVHQPELEQALAEVRRALRPGGRLIIHTSPNRVFEEVVYPWYVRNVHRAVLGVARLLRVRGRLTNEIVLPTARVPPHDAYERMLHVNPQSAGSLRAALGRRGFRVRRVDFWEPPHEPFFERRRDNFWLGMLDGVRYLRPLSRLAPLNRLFSNHVWVVAERT